MSDDRIDTLRRAAQALHGYARSLPGSPWKADENTYAAALESGCIWEPNTYWINAPREPVETRTVALAYDSHVSDYLTRLGPTTARAIANLLASVATEYESMRRNAEYLEVSNREAAETLRRGPHCLNLALGLAMSVLRELDEGLDEDQDGEDDIDD
jgi:hypothetical protein